MGTPRSAETARLHLEEAIGRIPERYKEGVSQANWQGPAASEDAEKLFNLKMQEVLSKKLRQVGVRKVSNSDWQSAASNKGGAVIGQRIRDNLDKQAANFAKVYAPVLRVVAGLKAREVDANANIDNRVKPVVKAWQDNRLRGR